MAAGRSSCCRRCPPPAAASRRRALVLAVALSSAPAAAVGVGAVAMLMSKDVRQSSSMLRRNMRHIRTWLEEQGAAAE